MSRLAELIERLCPDGVEYKPLGLVGLFLRGNGLQKSQLCSEGVPAVHYGQIHTSYGIWFSETISFVSERDSKTLRKAESGDLIIATTSEDDVGVGKASAWLGKTDLCVSGDSFIYRHRLNPKYISYFFQSDSFRCQKQKFITGTKVRRISALNLGKVKVPVPPLEVQEEIVRILDKFTALEAELETELETELAARRLQYAHYRDELLTFPDDGAERWMTIGDIATLSRGRVISKDYLKTHAGKYPVYSSQTQNSGIFGWIDSFDFDGEYLTWTTDGANAGSVFYQNGRFTITNVCGLVSVTDESVITKFLYHYLGVFAKGYVSVGMGNAKLMAHQFRKIRIPVPPLEEQRRIVDILDRFDALVNDISVGLPAELEARRKQYEYYRDRLLAF